MAGELLIFDAAASNVDGTDPGSALNLGPGTLYGIRALSAPAPPQTILYAGSIDTEGSVPAGRKHENRTITVTLLCSTAAALRTLEGKVGKVAREGGTLKWVLPNAETIIFDLHSADTFEPTIDKLHYVRAGAFCEVQLTLVAKPYGRGASVTLSGHTATSKAPLVFTETGIKGDMPALGSLRISNATQTKTFMVWGQQSRYYDSGSTAALFFEGEDCQAGVGAAVNAGPAGASGAGVNKTMRQSLTDTGFSGLNLGPSGVTSHIGTYVVYARVQAATANTGTVSVAFAWSSAFISPGTITNDYVPIATSAGTPIEGSWVVVNLGQVTLPKARLGTQRWPGSLKAKSTVAAGDIVDYDWVCLVPVDEGSGALFDAVSTISSTGAIDLSYDGTQLLFSNASALWGQPTRYEGDYLLIPPAGAEARTLRMIVLFAGPTSAAGNLSDSLVDAVNVDAVSATLTYVPRYLVVPEP